MCLHIHTFPRHLSRKRRRWRGRSILEAFFKSELHLSYLPPVSPPSRVPLQGESSSVSVSVSRAVGGTGTNSPKHPPFLTFIPFLEQSSMTNNKHEMCVTLGRSCPLLHWPEATECLTLLDGPAGGRAATEIRKNRSSWSKTTCSRFQLSWQRAYVTWW